MLELQNDTVKGMDLLIQLKGMDLLIQLKGMDLLIQLKDLKGWIYVLSVESRLIAYNRSSLLNTSLIEAWKIAGEEDTISTEPV